MVLYSRRVLNPSQKAYPPYKQLDKLLNILLFQFVLVSFVLGVTEAMPGYRGPYEYRLPGSSFVRVALTHYVLPEECAGLRRVGKDLTFIRGC